MAKKDYDKHYRSFLLSLQRARERSGLSQQEAGQRLGRNQSYISRCESGRRMITVVEMWELADLYNVSIHDLLG